MAFAFEGMIEIPLEELFTWAENTYGLKGGYERFYGVPKVNKSNQTLEISFAGSDTNDPSTWSKKPKAALEWEEVPNF
jgi:hypothetical protein